MTFFCFLPFLVFFPKEANPASLSTNGHGLRVLMLPNIIPQTLKQVMV